MWQIMIWMEDVLNDCERGECIAFNVPDPDMGGGCYAGTPFDHEGEQRLHRGYKAWCDLAELKLCRMLTPERAGNGLVTLRFQKIDTGASFHRDVSGSKEEKYGSDSRFAAIRKNEEPAFVAAYLKALEAVKVERRRRILDLGVNTGDEFELIRAVAAAESFASLELTGIDHSTTAIETARARFDDVPNVSFHVHDINRLETLGLERFDLIISIGTLQSPGIEFKQLFMSLVQDYLLKDRGAMILGFPNCRWMGGEMIYGAKAPNYPYPEMSLLYKDLYYCKKYLQQKGFRVTLTGKDYVFLTATSIKKRHQEPGS